MTDSNVEILQYKDQISKFIQYTLDIFSKTNRVYLSMDFEFDRDFKRNKHIMSLGQLMISYHNQNNELQNSPVYLMDFRIFPRKDLETFIDDILLNPKGLKILHGSESLDLPALRDLLKSDQKFKRLLMQMADTRHLCEIHHILSNRYQNTSYKKCNIYSALHNTGIITDAEYQKLSSIKINYNKPWRIRKLSQKQITYAMGDVIFLHNLYIAYQDLLGGEMIEVIMNAFRYTALVRSGILPIKNKHQNNKIKTRDLIERLEKKGILNHIQADSPIGPLSIRDLIRVDYSRKALIYLTNEIY